MISIIIKQIFK